MIGLERMLHAKEKTQTQDSKHALSALHSRDRVAVTRI
jgi:hypothetical protein